MRTSIGRSEESLNPRLPDEPKPVRPPQQRRLGFSLLYRLRPAIA
jgi:hypothetical protein